jgi:hypothetical protein
VVGIVVEALIWLAALARAAFEWLRREYREGVAAHDCPNPSTALRDPFGRYNT